MQTPARSCSLALPALILASAPPALAQEIRLPGAQWTFTIPEGWEQMADADLQPFNDLVQSRAQNRASSYAAGLYLGEDPSIYALIQPVNDPRMQGMDFDSLERAFGAETLDRAESEAQSAVGDLVSDLEIGVPRLDRENARVIMAIDMTDADGNHVKGVTQSLLWAGGAINVHAYAPAASFDAQLPQLLALADAVRFEPGQQFVPGQPRGFSWTAMLRTGLICAVVGGILGGLGSLLRRKQAGPTLLK